MAESINASQFVNQKLPKPIAFNCWKHHLRFIKDSLEKNEIFNTSHLNIHEIIQHIGVSNVDFYYGELDPEVISKEIIGGIESEIVINLQNFEDWLKVDGADFKCLAISDGSNWTVRMGQSKERYIHIHPSRHSKKTVRVKSSTLKTVIAYFFNFGLNDNQITSEKLNQIRNKFVKLPSLKPNSPLVAIFRLADRFFA